MNYHRFHYDLTVRIERVMKNEKKREREKFRKTSGKSISRQLRMPIAVLARLVARVYLMVKKVCRQEK